MNTPKKAIFFDLDGTLLDTAQDFAYAINVLLAKENKPPVNFDLFREQVFGETKRMISYAFNLTDHHPKFDTIREAFLNTYHENCTQKTVFFEGITELLDHLDIKKIPWGIITNKPAWLTTPIVKHFELDKRACCVISGDTLTACKPDPLPLWHACKQAATPPENAFYVGDLQTDVLTAKNAGLSSIAVTYGYHPPNTDFTAWDADYLVSSAHEIQHLLL